MPVQVFLAVTELVMNIIAASCLLIFAIVILILRPFDATMDFALQIINLLVSVGAICLSQAVSMRLKARYIANMHYYS